MDKYDNYSNEQSVSSHNASVDECQYEYDDYQHDEYINIKHNSFIPFTKPKNTLDILRLSSDKYEQYKHTEHIKQIISQFSFDNKIALVTFDIWPWSPSIRFLVWKGLPLDHKSSTS